MATHMLLAGTERLRPEASGDPIKLLSSGGCDLGRAWLAKPTQSCTSVATTAYAVPQTELAMKLKPVEVVHPTTSYV